jgi:hypothetical protein
MILLGCVHYAFQRIDAAKPHHDLVDAGLAKLFKAL